MSSSSEDTNHYLVDTAPTSEHKCSDCALSVDKGGIRVGVSADPSFEDASECKWFHAECFKGIKDAATRQFNFNKLGEKQARSALGGKLHKKSAADSKSKRVKLIQVDSSAEESSQSDSDAEVESEDDSGSEDDSDESLEEESEESESEFEDEDSDDGKKKKAKKKAPAAKSTAAAAKKKVAVKKSESDDESVEEKKGKKASAASAKKPTKATTKKNADLDKKMKALAKQPPFLIASGDVDHPVAEIPRSDERAAKLLAMSIDELKEFLRANQQVLMGKKEDLVQRVLDGEVNGRIPRCPACGKGRPQFNPESGKYTCPGYFNEDVAMRIGCTFASGTIARTKWLDPIKDAALIEEEKQAMANARQDAAPPLVAAAAENVVTAELEDAVRALGADMKAIAALVAGHLRKAQLTLPEDEAKAKIETGKVILAHRNAETKAIDVQAVVSTLLHKFPIKNVEAAKKVGLAPPLEAKEAVVPANSSIANLLDDFAAAEKEKATDMWKFKFAALKKAAAQIRTLDFEVTSGKELCAGKKKVAGIGKGSAAIIDDFLGSGKTHSQMLEDLKSGKFREKE